MATTSTYSTILAEIDSILSSVTDIGQVHSRPRGLKSIEEFMNKFKAKNQIRGWWIQRQKTPEEKIDELGKNRRNYSFTIRGIMSFSDENNTDSIFQNLIESICNAFRTVYNLNNKCFIPRVSPGLLFSISLTIRVKHFLRISC